MRGQRWLAVAGLLLAALVVLLLLWDWNWFKGPLERMVQARTGRALHIGHLDVDLGSTSTLRADRVDFANAPWAQRADMARAARVEIDLRLWPLLRGDLQLPEVRLVRPDVLLQTAPRPGEPGNWDFLGGGNADRPLPLKRLRVDDGTLRFVDAAGRTDIQLAVHSGAPKQANAAPPLLLQGNGRWRGVSFSVRHRCARL